MIIAAIIKNPHDNLMKEMMLIYWNDVIILYNFLSKEVPHPFPAISSSWTCSTPSRTSPTSPASNSTNSSSSNSISETESSCSTSRNQLLTRTTSSNRPNSSAFPKKIKTDWRTPAGKANWNSKDLEPNDIQSANNSSTDLEVSCNSRLFSTCPTQRTRENQKLTLLTEEPE